MKPDEILTPLGLRTERSQELVRRRLPSASAGYRPPAQNVRVEVRDSARLIVEEAEYDGREER